MESAFAKEWGENIVIQPTLGLFLDISLACLSVALFFSLASLNPKLAIGCAFFQNFHINAYLKNNICLGGLEEV